MRSRRQNPQFNSSFAISLAVTGVLLSSFSCQFAECRNQWDINHGATNPPVDPRFAPGGQWSGQVPTPMKQDFWKAQLANRIPGGTVLTAILEDKLSSGKNKAGDTFTMTLEDGFVANGTTLVPPKSKIIGTVIQSVSAKSLRHGAPGRMQVSLQSLVFPDGSHVPIMAFIDSNPNAAFKKPAKVRHLGTNIADYGDSLKAMAFSFVSGPGFMMNKMNRGLDFELDRGEAIPIRLTRSLDIPPGAANMIAQPPGSPAAGSDAGRMPYPPGATGVVPGLVDAQGPVFVPPRMVTAPAGTGTSTESAGSGEGTPIPDPNAIFSQPIKPQTLNELPDPF